MAPSILGLASAILGIPTITTFIQNLISALTRNSEYIENVQCTRNQLQEFEDEDLLDKMSILLTPTAYSDGSLNTVIPPYQVLPTELVTNGDFSDGTNNWTAVSAVISASNNILTVDDSANAGGDSRAVQSFTTKVGVTYKVRFNRISTTSSFYLGIGSGVGYNNIFYANLGTDLGIYERTFIATDTTSTIALITSGTGITKFSEVSVKEIQEADFDFSRGSSATRVNEQGLVEDVQILSGELVQNGNFEQISSELVTNGNFDTDSDWSKDSGWSIEDGKAIALNTLNRISQSFSTTTSSVYKVTFTVLDYVSGDIKVQFTGGTTVNSDWYNDNGTFIVYLTALSGNNLLSFKGRNGAQFTGSIDNVSVKEVGQNWAFYNSSSNTNSRFEDNAAVLDASANHFTRFISSSSPMTIGNLYRVTYEVIEPHNTHICIQ